MRCCFKKKPTWQEMPDRSIYSNVLYPEFVGNQISTSKYNCVTFVPKNLIEQFSKVANLYFLIMGLLQMINEISASDGVPTTYFPLSVIIVISALKDLYEDYKRHKSDNEENNKPVEVLGESGFKNVAWKEIKVGDIVKINQNEFFCADMLVLKTSGDQGNCYIETKNLDGETNLKHKKVPPDFVFMQNYSEKQLFEMRAKFDYEKPNPYLYTFTGTFQNEEANPVPLDSAHFVLRGCSLRNTKFVIGLVAYTGHDTKIMLNSVKARPKYSKVEIAMNRYIITVFIVQQIVCIFSALYYSIWYLYHKYELSYLVIDTEGFENNAFIYNFFVRFGSWLIIFQNFVPISLIVTLEMVKFIQGSVIAKDEKLKHELSGTYVTVQTSNLNEELGQIEYIFSDKTGTLTCNIMEFKCFSVRGVSYGEENTMKENEFKEKPEVTNVSFRDAKLFMDIERSKPIHREAIIDAMFCLSLCHTIITEDKGPNELIYNASSPDELALVNFAKFSGFQYMGTESEQNFQNMLVLFNKKIHKFRLLQTLEFNSTRKRQSVIVKNSDGRIVLYTKGADSVIEKRLKRLPDDDEEKVKTWENLERYASQGLRTLLLAKREISPREYEKWAESYLKACTTMVNREQQMADVQDEIERELIVVGATAIEDKLQDEVGETIMNLREAGLKVWVLTGDKIETAINIGFSCKLLNNSMERIIVDGLNEKEVADALQEGLTKIKAEPSKEWALVLSGDALIHGVKEDLSKMIVEITDSCKSVIACRVSPKQKQEVVSLVRREVSTLAIGDGANDVNMITAAHVGIGIKGVEGQQAARSSDYAVGEFKTLRRLLLFYGRESYRKNSILICYNFFKNMILVVPQFWSLDKYPLRIRILLFIFIVLFQFYNMFYTALPIIIYALYDKEHKGRDFLANPDYYSLGLKNKIFTRWNFLFWILIGVWQAFLNTFASYYIFTCITSEELTLDFWAVGMTVYGSAIIIANLKILLFSNQYSLMSVGIIFGSVIFYYSNYVLESYFYTSADVYNSFERTFNTYYFYLYLVFIIVTTSCLDSVFDKLINGPKATVPEISGFVEMKDLEDHDVRPSVSEIKELPQAPTLKRQHTGYAFSQEESVGYIDSYYKRAQN